MSGSVGAQISGCYRSWRWFREVKRERREGVTSYPSHLSSFAVPSVNSWSVRAASFGIPLTPLVFLECTWKGATGPLRKLASIARRFLSEIHLLAARRRGLVGRAVALTWMSARWPCVYIHVLTTCPSRPPRLWACFEPPELGSTLITNRTQSEQPRCAVDNSKTDNMNFTSP